MIYKASSIQNQQRRAADINDILESMGLGSRVTIGLETTHGSPYTYMVDMYTKNPSFDEYYDLPLRDIISRARELAKPKWTLVTAVCLDLVGQDVYVDKTTKISIVSLGVDREGSYLTTDEGKVYPIDNLYIKG